MNVAEWEIGMHEWLAVEEVSDEMLQQFMDAVGGDFTDKADLIRAMGVYHGRKYMRPDFEAGIFVKDAHAVVEADKTPDKQQLQSWRRSWPVPPSRWRRQKRGRLRRSPTRK